MSTIGDKQGAPRLSVSTVRQQSPAQLANLKPFRPGQSGNPIGRKRGSRNKISEDFLSALADDFSQHGASIIAKVRKTRPHEYLKIVASVIPRELDVKPPPASVEDLTIDELTELIRESREAVASMAEESH
jgi:hypothetical protein